MNHSVFEWLGCVLATVLTAAQTEHVFQIISLVLTCLATGVTLAFNIWKWWKKSSADNKISQEEIEELVDIIDDAKEEIKNVK